jgi:hypothetical protein
MERPFMFPKNKPGTFLPYNCIKNRSGEAEEMKKALLCDTTPLQFPPWQGGKEGGMVHQLKTGGH